MKALTQYVNGVRNQVILSGIVHYLNDKGSALLLQGNSPSRAIPVQFSGATRRPAEGELVEVLGHVRGFRDEHARRSRAAIDVFYVKRTSLGGAPRRFALLGGVRLAGEKPLASLDEIKQVLVSQVQMEEEVIDHLLKAGRNDDGRFLNRVFVSGFVGFKAFIPPTLEGDGGGYITFNLLQGPDEARGIPVRVPNTNVAFGRQLKQLLPVNVVGSIGMDLTEGEGELIRSLYIRAEKNNVGGALAKDFEGSRYPRWWQQMVLEHSRKLSQARNGTAQSESVAAPEADHAAAGVTETADLI